SKEEQPEEQEGTFQQELLQCQAVRAIAGKGQQGNERQLLAVFRSEIRRKILPAESRHRPIARSDEIGKPVLRPSLAVEESSISRRRTELPIFLAVPEDKGLLDGNLGLSQRHRDRGGKFEQVQLLRRHENGNERDSGRDGDAPPSLFRVAEKQ